MTTDCRGYVLPRGHVFRVPDDWVASGPHDDCILHIPAAGQDRPRPHQGPEFSGNGWGQLSPDSALHTLAPDLSVWL